MKREENLLTNSTINGTISYEKEVSYESSKLLRF